MSRIRHGAKIKTVKRLNLLMLYLPFDM